MIEEKYNQIWHGIKTNKNIVVNHNFIVCKLQTPISAFGMGLYLVD